MGPAYTWCYALFYQEDSGMSAFRVNITGCLFNHQGNILASTGLKIIIVLVAMLEIFFFFALEFKTEVAELAV